MLHFFMDQPPDNRRTGRKPKSPSDVKVHLTIRMPGHLLAWVDKQAPRNKSDVITEAVQEKMDRETRKRK